MSAGATVFVRSRERSLRLCLVALAFCVLGVALVSTGAQTGWLSLVAAPFALFFGFQLLRPPRLDVDDEGFSASGGFGRRQRFEYGHCGEFQVFRVPGGRGSEAIAFDWGLRPGGWAADSTRRRYGFSETLMNTFGSPAQEIVDELNTRRAAARAR